MILWSRCLVICVLVTLLSSTAGLAAEAPLTLADAIERASRSSPEVTARESGVNSAEAMLLPSGQLPDPELVIGVENLPVTGPQAGSLTDDFMTMRKIGISQRFPRAAKRELRSQRAADEVRLAKTQAATTSLQVKRQAAQAWIALYVAQESSHRLQGLLPNFELQARIANGAVSGGRRSSSEALAARSALLEFEDRLRVAEQMERQARFELARWLPEDADRVLATPPTFEDLPPPAALTDVHHHSALVAFDAQLDAARTEVALAQAEKKPDWSVELDYAKRGPAFSNMVTLEFRVGLPLFSGKRQDPVVGSKRATVRQIEADREVELRMHRNEISQRIAEWQTLKERTHVFREELLPLAHERARLALAALQAGQSGINPVLEAQAAEIDAELKSLELLGQLGNAWSFLNYQQDFGHAGSNAL